MLSISISKVRILNRFVHRNTLCSTTKVKLQPESPELPAWVKFSDGPTPPNADSDDDFVIPSLSLWVDTHMLAPNPTLPSHTLHPNTLDHVHAITTLLKDLHSSPDSVAPALDGRGFHASHTLVEKVLKRFSNDWVPAFGFFKWAKAQTGYTHSPQLYSLMVDILGKSQNFDLVWELVEEMPRLQEGYMTLGTMFTVMRRLSKARKYRDAIEAFRRMEDFGVKKDTAALNALMDALVKGNSVEHAQDVLSEFKDEIPLNSQSFNVLIHGWCKARDFDKARKVMEDMKEHGFVPDVFSYTSLVEAYCRERDFRKVDQVLEEMRGNGCNPNHVTYTIVMLALGKAGQLNEAMNVYEKMKSDGCVPDTPIYSSMIFILVKAGRLKDACEVFEDMPKQGAAEEVLAYNTMISAACAHSKEETALRLLKEMEDGQCKSNVFTYHPLLKMCCKKSRMKVLKFLLDHMLKNDVSLDSGTYSLLVHGLCKSGKLEQAWSYFEEMVLRGLVPKHSTLKVLAGKLESKNMLKEKERVEKVMKRVSQKQSI